MLNDSFIHLMFYTVNGQTQTLAWNITKPPRSVPSAKASPNASAGT